MSVLNSIVLLASVASALLFPLFTGHGLAAHEPRWFLYGGAFLGLSIALLATHLGLQRRSRHDTSSH